MSAAPVSVVIVSRGRPELLARCLTGVGQLCHPAFEVVVVADPAGAAAVAAKGWEPRLKLLPFDAANISSARNTGIAAASGEIVAFIDDDAVPEPTWLDHLTAPFADPGVAATGGFVLGRNGISLQWAARGVDARGRKITLAHSGEAPFEPVLPAGFATKTEGTNFAARRTILAALGGFDPAFRFYLDETDVNMRLAARGLRTVLVPRALVHHGFAASVRRAGDRAPTDLTEIGASSAVFLRKHSPGADMADELARITADQRRALLRYMVDGGLEPRDIALRLAELEAGFAEGLARSLAPLPELSPPQAPFLDFSHPSSTRQSRHFAGRPWNRRTLLNEAGAAVARGEIVTVFRFSPTALPHRVRFHEGGWWEQRGGLFGRADRTEPVFRLQSFRDRVAQEWARVTRVRQCRADDIKS
jgi:O-antigen biosynthesis protein